MTMDAADVAVLVAVVVAGPWGVVLIVALVRGYDLRVLLTRRPHRDRSGDGSKGATDGGQDRPPWA